MSYDSSCAVIGPDVKQKYPLHALLWTCTWQGCTLVPIIKQCITTVYCPPNCALACKQPQEPKAKTCTIARVYPATQQLCVNQKLSCHQGERLDAAETNQVPVWPKLCAPNLSSYTLCPKPCVLTCIGASSNGQDSSSCSSSHSSSCHRSSLGLASAGPQQLH